MEYVNIVLISVSIFLILKVIISRISSNKPPRKAIEALQRSNENMKLVNETENDDFFIKEYSDGKYSQISYTPKNKDNLDK